MQKKIYVEDVEMELTEANFRRFWSIILCVRIAFILIVLSEELTQIVRESASNLNFDSFPEYRKP